MTCHFTAAMVNIFDHRNPRNLGNGHKRSHSDRVWTFPEAFSVHTTPSPPNHVSLTVAVQALVIVKLYH